MESTGIGCSFWIFRHVHACGGICAALLCAGSALPAAADAVTLLRSDGKYDGNEYCSLTPGHAYVNWSDGLPLHSDATYYIGAGLCAYASRDASCSIEPTIMLAGDVSPLGLYSKTYTFGDLRILSGGRLIHDMINLKKGRITILAEDAASPAQLLFLRSDANGEYRLGATVSGSQASHLLFTNRHESAAGTCLAFYSGSDWTGFAGVLSVADGLGVVNMKNVPVESPGRFSLGNEARINWVRDNAPLSLGELTLGANAAITNSATSPINVSGLLSTGRDCYWLCYSGGTVGCLRLDDGTRICVQSRTVAPVFSVTNRLELGDGVLIDLARTFAAKGLEPTRRLVMRLAPEAVAAGLPDFSKASARIAYYYDEWGGSQPDVGGRLAVEDDPDVAGGRCVYATHLPIIRYVGENEWGGSGYDCMDPDADQAGNWEDGLYPHSGAIYAVTSRTDIVFADADASHPQRTSTFPGEKLLCDDLSTLYLLAGSSFVSNLVMHARTTLYARGLGVQRFGGNILVSSYAPSQRDANAATVRLLGERTFHLDSSLSGDGALCIESYYPAASGGGTVYLTGDNEAWLGWLKTSWTRVSSSPDADETLHTRIVVGDAKALGGNPDSFCHDKIELSDYAEIQFTGTAAMAAANRGLHVDGNGAIRVDGDSTATLASPLTLCGTLRKTGPGTLGLGGRVRYAANDDVDDATAPTEGANVIAVQEGAIKARDVAGAEIYFESGTAVKTDLDYGALDVSGATVSLAGTLYVGADPNAVERPEEILTIPVLRATDAQAASLDGMVRAKKTWKGLAATLLKESADGVTTYSVRYARVGARIIVR